MASQRPRDVVLHLQIALSAATNGAVTVDGLLGPETRSVYNSLPEQLRELIHGLYIEPSPFLRDRMAMEVSTPEPAFVSYERGEIFKLAALASQQTGVPESYLRLMLRQENWVTPTSVKTSVTGSFRGIAQFGQTTWNTIDDRYPDYRLGEWAAGSRDPSTSLMAACGLYNENKRSFQIAFPQGEYEDWIAYLFHQQGATSAINYLRGQDLAYPEQSSASIEMFDRSRARLLS